MFPSRAQFVRYLEDYAREASVAVETGVSVLAARHVADRWHVRTTRGSFESRHLVVATGIASSPYWPRIADRERFRGGLSHSASYRSPAPHRGQRVLVVGAGNSGSEIALELSKSGVSVALAVRSGVNVLPRTILQVPVQYHALLLERCHPWVRKLAATGLRALSQWMPRPEGLPRSPASPFEKPPVIGLELVAAIRDGRITARPAVEAFRETGVVFADGSCADFDHVLLATGYRAAVDFIEPRLERDARGFPLRNGVASAKHPNLYFVGHDYGPVGALVGIGRDATRASAAIADASKRGRRAA